VPLARSYAGLAAGGHIEADAGQEAVLAKLEDLRLELASAAVPRRAGPFGWLPAAAAKAKTLRGLYLWGAAGRGKTMLMDLFFDSAPVERKSRVHFHEFMASVHAFVHEWRDKLRKGLVKGDDPIAAAVQSIAGKAQLLCFDEFSVTDIADAMILGRLFAALFERGAVIVATSNVRPDLLYQDGFNRALFLPFIAMLEERMDIVHLDARADFRLEKLGDQTVYFVPADRHAAEALTRAFKALTGAVRGAPMKLQVLGRELKIPEACANVARFTFAELCATALSAADYLTIARKFHTVVLDAIPVISEARRDEAKRFITLIDTLYDRRVKLISSAAAEPAELYLGESGFLAFEFQRTASRLIEMRSSGYLALPHGHLAPAASSNAGGPCET
jgi:cell division protein ZapE